MKVNLFDNKGKKKTTKVDIEDSVFNVESNDMLLSQVVNAYMSNKRQSNAKVKDRGEVRGGGKKPWKQKGTGRARHGSTRSPIWTKGGVTFGPTPERNYVKNLNRKVRQAALRIAFSMINKENKLFVMEKFEPKKTQDVLNVIDSLGLDAQKSTFVQSEENGLFRNSRNISNVDVKRIGEINAYDILNAGNLILFKEDLDLIHKNWAK